MRWDATVCFVSDCGHFWSELKRGSLFSAAAGDFRPKTVRSCPSGFRRSTEGRCGKTPSSTCPAASVAAAAAAVAAWLAEGCHRAPT